MKLKPFTMFSALFAIAMMAMQHCAFGESRTNAPTAVNNEDYRVIVERNIFDPARRPVSRAAARTEAPRRPKVEAFALVGTLSSDKGQYAFFDGTSTSYKKALHPGEKMGDYTVADIAQNQVTLKTEDGEIDFPMGMQMRRVDEGEWKLLAMTGTFTAPVRPTAGRATSRTSSSKVSSSSLLDSLSEDADPGDLADLPDKALRKLAKEMDGGLNSDKKSSKSDPELRALKRLDKLDKRSMR